ncbi:hypothetical protein [Actinoplanes sp. NPDC026619]|uniref:hypothetical protein n=1 Tax=Actinoplanes sp. NPDC026619 TaxID=3155798 RepID=UPI0033F937A6
MPDEPPTGRAPVRPPSRGRARVGRAVGKARLPADEVTGLIRSDVPPAAPVFVDPSGARRRRMRWAVYVAGVLLVLVLAAVWASQLSGPAAPPARPPCASGACPR